MNRILLTAKCRFVMAALPLLAFLLALPAAWSFPPDPDGLIYGMAKDQYGTPLLNTGDQVILQTQAGVQMTTAIQPGLAIGINFALAVPMDAGVTPDPYVTNALTVGTAFKLYVVVGSVTNLPIEMTAGYVQLGQPAQQTCLNLTLGVDSNRDGIPDAWEQIFLAEIGTNVSLANINPNADYAHDGRTLTQEYLLGNYPFDPADNFGVELVSQNAGSAALAFTTMTGRSYTVLGSSDLQNWMTLPFTIPAVGPEVQSYYYSPIIQPLLIQTLQPTNQPQMQFFKLRLQ
jgi:hypothetical protein